MRTTTKKLGRNDPCWCGSGGKYKKCHLNKLPEPGKPIIPQVAGKARTKIRKAGAFNAQLMDHIRPLLVAGTVLQDIDREVHAYTNEHGHRPATLGYKGFPKSCCTSVNEVVCHGIPDDYALQDGDIVNVDLTTIVDEWHGDQSETFLIGNVSDEAKRLVQCCFDSLHLAIDALTPGCAVNTIGKTIQAHADECGFSVVRDFHGHGIGLRFHQAPGIPHYEDPRFGDFELLPGICFTIEPMLNVGSHECQIDSHDGWTARTADGKLSAQFEHTIMMTAKGPEILTLTKNGPQKGHKF